MSFLNDHLFFRDYNKYSSVDSTIKKSCLNISDYVFDILNLIPRLFTITTNNSKNYFNIEFLIDASETIKNELQKDPKKTSFHINIEDKKNVMKKMEQLYIGKVITFKEDEISTTQKITKILQISRCPNFMKPPSLQNDSDYSYLNDYSDKFSNANRVSFNKPNLINFIKSCESLNSFCIRTKRGEYRCNKFAALSSGIIHKKNEENPSINEFFFEFDDEFGEFNEFCELFNFKDIQLTPNNIESIKKIAEDLEINMVLPQIEEFISNYENSINKISEKQLLTDTIEQLFEWLHSIPKLTSETIKELIIQSIWTKTEENVQEFAACILQIISSDHQLHPHLLNLLVLLNNESDESNNLKILLPLIVNNLLTSFSSSKSKCSFVYLLFKNGLISKEKLLNSLLLGIKSNSNNDIQYRKENENENNVILWFLPELLEINAFDFRRINGQIKNFINLYYPSNIDKYKKMRDLREPDDDIAISIIHDDANKLQAFLSKINIDKDDINQYAIQMNIFDSFIEKEKTTFLNYAALYGSIKCFKYLLLNHYEINEHTFTYALKGGNIEIIRTVEQQQIGKKRNNSSVDLFSPLVIKHQNKLFDWLLEQENNNLSNSLLKNLIELAVQNGNAHAFIQCINQGIDMNSLPLLFCHQIIKKSCERGFFRLMQIMISFMNNLIIESEEESNQNSLSSMYLRSYFLRNKIDFSDCSISFGNISIYRLILSKIKKDKLDEFVEKSLMNSINYNHLNITKFIMENNVKKIKIEQYLIKSIQLHEHDIFYYLSNKIKIYDFNAVLISSCQIGDFEISKHLIELLYNYNSDAFFTDAFITAASIGSEEICSYMINKNVNLDYSKFIDEKIINQNEKIFFLIIPKIDLNFKELFMCKCLYPAINNKQYNIVEYLMKEDLINKGKALYEAVRIKNIEMVNLILKYNDDPYYVNQIFENGTALYESVVYGDVNIIKRLLSIPGINPNLYNDVNKTPFIKSFSQLNIEIIECFLDFYGEDIKNQIWQINEGIKAILIKDYFFKKDEIVNILNRIIHIKGIDVNYKSETTLLLFVCEINEINLVKILLQNDRIDTNMYLPGNGNSPLIVAIESNNTEIAKLLIEFPKTNVNFRNYQNETALVLAAKRNQKEIVNLILNNENFDYKMSNLDLAFYMSKGEIEQILSKVNGLNVNNCMKYNPNDSTYSIASKLVSSVYLNNGIQSIEIIINHSSFDINKSQAKIALFTSVHKNEFDIFKILIKLFNYVIDFNDESLLINAINSLSIINEVFTNSQYKISKCELNALLITSIKTGSLEILEKIFNYNKNNSIIIEYNKLIPLNKFIQDYQIYKKSVFTLIENEIDDEKIIEFFLEKGADPNIKDDQGIYPLQHAITIQSFKFVNSLIKSKKIDFSVRMNDKNQNYAHIASIGKNPEILNLILNTCSDYLNEQDDDGNTPLILAVKNKNRENVRLLFQLENIDYLHKNKNGEDALAVAIFICKSNIKYSFENDQKEIKSKRKYYDQLMSLL